ncbi:uncharacterized protein LOC110708922 [Chenopodium quinoa]|uniref:uncharacterized protein LOC110708922 n=1 Tax=Chenopodium quinoa TaxID=63459 RepID=UPI000B78537C|nr:uncharacterized protein LOC110708922 [Chenopodium quinoa]
MISCKYPSSPASILGYVAASLVLANQIAISAIARSACRGTNNTYTQKSFVNPTFCFILSWICSGSGIALLLSGAYLSGHQEFLAATKACYTLKPRLFDAGGSMEIIGCTLGLCSAYYFWANSQPAPGQAVAHQDGVAVADSSIDAASTYSNNPKQQQYV